MRTRDAIRLAIRGLLSLFIVMLFAYAYYTNPNDELLIGALIGMFTTVVNWWLGSSQTSVEKNDTIADQLHDQATGKADDPVHVEPI